MQKKLVSVIYLKNGQAVTGRTDHTPFAGGDAAALAEDYSNRGADALLVMDLSQGDAEHEQSLGLMKEMSRRVDIPMYGCGNIRRTEDVKKILYAGCRKALLHFGKDSNRDMLKEVSSRFGKEKIGVCLAPGCAETLSAPEKEKILEYAGLAVLLAEGKLPGQTGEIAQFTGEEEGTSKSASEKIHGTGEMANTSGAAAWHWPAGEMPWLAVLEGRELSGQERAAILKLDQAEGLAEESLRTPGADIMAFKAALQEEGIPMNLYESSLAWSDFKKNSDGLVPVIVQDYKTDEVLMEAYMNQEAYEMTVRSGRMTYFSRSRQELWIKGLTSGHFQYVKELRIDCDNDTILARVAQVGAACHTGNRSCFYRTMMKKEYAERNPMRILEEVYRVIEDRKAHPKEGSYTNYLFDKGIDKILKKVGEEASEIIIAAKNPNPEEVKYEISDFLYHVMVLMSLKDITWEDITRELTDR